MGTLEYIFLNLAVVGTLAVSAFKFTEYNFAWWLRNQRATSVMNKFYKKNVFLEIKLPQEIFKNPSAMEIIMNALNQGLGHEHENLWDVWTTAMKPTDDGHGHKVPTPFWKGIVAVRKKFFTKYVGGGIRMWHSLEIYSIEGQIKFYIMTQDKNAEIFKAYAYSQYPGIEVTQVEDPSLPYSYNNKVGGKPNIYVGRYEIPKDKDYMPIKTYVDYGLEKDPKEEYKVDPLTPLLEAMAAAGPGERFFFQILIRPTIWKDEWHADTKKRMDEIYAITREEKNHKYDPKGKIVKQDKKNIDLTDAEKKEIELLQKNLEKPGFDTIIRMFYHVDDPLIPTFLNKGVFTVVNAMKSFNKPGFGAFEFQTCTIDGDTPFLDPTGGFSEGKRFFTWFCFKMRSGFYQENDPMEGYIFKLLKAAKYRRKVGKNREWAGVATGELKEYYQMPGQYKHRGEGFSFVLNLEELVTLWHFPGKAFANTSGRVDSIKSDPPRNLPI
jgi:hypothetical protein